MGHRQWTWTSAEKSILIHTVNNSLFPEANPDSVTWTGPPPEIVTVQSLLYASLTTSLFAAFITMLSKQWVNRYLRNRGGSAADKSRDRQRRLDRFEKWHLHPVIENLPVMLQLALLLLGCALSQYLWTISRTVAGVIVAMTLFGITSYVLFTFAATLYYNCPYQTPPSILTRTIIRYLKCSDVAFAHSLQSFFASFTPIRNLRRVLRHLRSGACTVVKRFGGASAVAEGAEAIPLTVVMAPPAWDPEGISINWEVCKADARCISWIFDSTTDTDVIFSTVQFAADMIWYPETAGVVSPHVLADLFFDCLLNGWVIPEKSEHDPSAGRQVTRLTHPVLLTVTLIPPSASRARSAVPPGSDPDIVGGRMEFRGQVIRRPTNPLPPPSPIFPREGSLRWSAFLPCPTIFFCYTYAMLSTYNCIKASYTITQR